MKVLIIISIVTLFLLAGCSEEIVGGDKDEHGCIGSAGYQWCETKEKCYRIWEEECPITKEDCDNAEGRLTQECNEDELSLGSLDDLETICCFEI